MFLRALLFLIFAIGVSYAQSIGGGSGIIGASNNSNSSPSVVCNFLTGIATGVGAGTCIPSPTVCDGVTDNTASFDAFASWATGTWQASHSGQIELFIPSGRTCTDTSFSIQFANIKNLLVVAYGVTLTGNYSHLGNNTIIQDAAHSVRTAAANVGDTSVTINPSAPTQPNNGCLTVATCAALFTVGNYAVMMGFDLQTGVGFPPNANYAQFVKIVGVNSSTGVITFDRILRDSYKTTWPNYNPPVNPEVDWGGPATLYALSAGWGATIEWRGITFNPQAGNQLDADGLDIRFTDVTCISDRCFAPSTSYSWTFNNVKTPNANLEADKIVENWTINNSSGVTITFQSAGSFRNLVMNNSTYSQIAGLPLIVQLNNTTLTSQILFGPHLYGGTKSVSIANSNITLLAGQEFIIWYGNSNEGLNNASGVSMTGGVITVPNSYISATAGEFGWAFPGANLCWADVSNACVIMFQMTDVTQDATNTYFHTNAPNCELACWSFSGGKLGVNVHPAPQATFTNNSGDFQLVGYNSSIAGAPLYSYSKTTKTGVNSGTPQYIQMWGNLKKLTAAISSGNNYTGSLSANVTLGNLFGQWVTTAPAFTAYTPAIINAKSAGTRTLDATSGAPATWTGSAGFPFSGDTTSNLSQTLWEPGTYINSSDDTTSDPSHPWSMNVEVITTQNVVNPP